MVAEICGVYVIRHLPSGRVYVGSTVNLSKRWSRHRSTLTEGTHPNQHLQAAWGRDGGDAFEWEVVELCAPAKRIGIEQHYIDTWAACDPRRGFNKAPTAGVSPGMTGRTHSVETVERIRAANRRRKPRDQPGDLCPKGHVKDGTYRKANGRLRCQTCEREAARDRQRRKLGVPNDWPAGQHFNGRR